MKRRETDRGARNENEWKENLQHEQIFWYAKLCQTFFHVVVRASNNHMSTPELFSVFPSIVQWKFLINVFNAMLFHCVFFLVPIFLVSFLVFVRWCLSFSFNYAIVWEPSAWSALIILSVSKKSRSHSERIDFFSLFALAKWSCHNKILSCTLDFGRSIHRSLIFILLEFRWFQHALVRSVAHSYRIKNY